MKGQFENKYGRVVIGNDVIATYAGSVAVECFGIVGMAAVNMKDGIVKLLKKDYLTHGINVSINENNEITIDFHVIISYGVSISTVSDNLIETVKYRVEEFTGMRIKKINIFVEGVRVIQTRFQRFKRVIDVEARIAAGFEQASNAVLSQRPCQFIRPIDVDERLLPRFPQYRQCNTLPSQHRLKTCKFCIKILVHGIIEQVSELQPRQRRRGMVDDCAIQHGTPSIVLVITNHKL